MHTYCRWYGTNSPALSIDKCQVFPTSGEQMHGQETTIQQTFHLHESQGFFYLFTTNVKGSMQCFLACILHAPAPNTYPNFCPPEVNPCSVKTVHKNLVVTKRVHLLLHPPAILQLAFFFFFCQLLIITTDLLYLVSIESTAHPPNSIWWGVCTYTISVLDTITLVVYCCCMCFSSTSSGAGSCE